jgi:hypothetical protein
MVHPVGSYDKDVSETLFFSGRNIKEDTMKFSQADSRVKISSLSDVSGNKSVPVFRV